MNCTSTGGAMPWLRIAQPEKNPYLRADQTDQLLTASNYYGPSSRRIAPEISCSSHLWPHEPHAGIPPAISTAAHRSATLPGYFVGEYERADVSIDHLLHEFDLVLCRLTLKGLGEICSEAFANLIERRPHPDRRYSLPKATKMPQPRCD
jgi:hypothetical protein